MILVHTFLLNFGSSDKTSYSSIRLSKQLVWTVYKLSYDLSVWWLFTLSIMSIIWFESD